MAKHRILIVDDEPRYVWSIRVNLEDEGYETITASDGRTAVSLATESSPDLILLDVMMPDINGFKVAGLDAGADDYVTKPFGADELLARVRAVLRRVEVLSSDMPEPRFEAGDLRIDFIEQRVYVRDREVRLTPTEFRLLREMVRQPGRVLVPDYLLERVWSEGYTGETRVLRLAIHRLRLKIEIDPQDPQYIQTRPGMGYIFVVPE